VDTDKLTSCSTASNVVTCSEPSNTVLGYYMVTDTTYVTSVQYIKCNGSACAKETPGTNKGIAKLITDDNKVKLCITGDTNDPLPEFKATSTKYMISIATANAFSSSNQQDSFALVSITDTSITVSDSSGYYIASPTTNALISVKDTEGTLYNCDANGVCTATASDNLAATDVGYYKYADTTSFYIKCYKDTTTSTYKCGTIEAPATTVICGSSTIGQLVKGGKFCLNGSKEAAFETTANSKKMYQVSYSANSIFASTVTEEGTYGIVEVTTNSIKLKSTVFKNSACVSTSTLEVTDASSCSNGTEQCKGFTASSNFCYYDCVNSTGKNCNKYIYIFFKKTLLKLYFLINFNF